MTSMAIAHGLKRKKMGMKSDADPDMSSMHEDVVDRVMAKRMAEGGMVNDESDRADSKSADFDELDQEPVTEFSYTGANSGDELGNAQEEEDRRDIVARVMRKRMKQSNPRPA